MSAPLSNVEKARAIVRLFEEGRDQDAYRAMQWMLTMASREWPQWLKDVSASVDALTKEDAA